MKGTYAYQLLTGQADGVIDDEPKGQETTRGMGRTSYDVGVNVKSVVGRVDGGFPVILLAQGQGAAVYARPVHVGIALHSRRGQSEVLKRRGRQMSGGEGKTLKHRCAT